MNRPLRLRIIFIVSVLASLGSLYFGFFGDPIINYKIGNSFFDPRFALKICDLCRYTRIIIYPIALLSWIALIRKDTMIRTYILPLSIIGIIISGYQNLLVYSNGNLSGFCDQSNPCSEWFLDWLGFITIPLLALIALISILIASIYGASLSRTLKETEKKK